MPHAERLPFPALKSKKVKSTEKFFPWTRKIREISRVHAEQIEKYTSSARQYIRRNRLNAPHPLNPCDADCSHFYQPRANREIAYGFIRPSINQSYLNLPIINVNRIYTLKDPGNRYKSRVSAVLSINVIANIANVFLCSNFK